MSTTRETERASLSLACHLRRGVRVTALGHFFHLTDLTSGPGGLVLELAEPGMRMEGLRWTVPPDMVVTVLESRDPLDRSTERAA